LIVVVTSTFVLVVVSIVCSSVSATLCSSSVVLVSCLVGVTIGLHDHFDGAVSSTFFHCAISFTVTQSSVVTQVHSGILL
jgi:hypothetical protein